MAVGKADACGYLLHGELLRCEYPFCLLDTHVPKQLTEAYPNLLIEDPRKALRRDGQFLRNLVQVEARISVLLGQNAYDFADRVVAVRLV